MKPVLPVATLRPSRALLRATGVLYFFAALIPLLLPWPGAVRAPLLMLILADGLWQHWRLRRTYGIAAVRVEADHQLHVRYHDEPDWHLVARKAGSYRLPGLLILHVHVEGRRVQRWLVAGDMLEPASWHRLKVWARWRWAEEGACPSLWLRAWRRVRRCYQRFHVQ